MNERGSATENEMISAFLRAEMDSPKLGNVYRGYMTWCGLNRKSLIDQADLADAKANHTRAKMLTAIQGYRANRGLFKGFPADVQWRRVELTHLELGRLKYSNFPRWITLNGGSRSVVDRARSIETDLTVEKVKDRIKAVAEKVRQGHYFPGLIVVEADSLDLILVDGHIRATAYVQAEPSNEIELLVGSSSLLKHWAYY
ncbi:MAG: hypothetical protein LAO51_19025 [Acidobacteriia bacterium]|nr:hypothetical protein [Terriglobia bacterium]